MTLLRLLSSGLLPVAIFACSDSTTSTAPPSGDASAALDTGPSSSGSDAGGLTDTGASLPEASTSSDASVDSGKDAAGGAGGCLIAGPTCMCYTPNPAPAVYTQANCASIASTIYCAASEAKLNGVDQGTACSCYQTSAARDNGKSAWQAGGGGYVYSNVRDVATCPQ